MLWPQKGTKQDSCCRGTSPQSTLLSGTSGHRGPHRHGTLFTQTVQQGRLQRHSALGEQPSEAEGGDGPDCAGPGLLLGGCTMLMEVVLMLTRFYEDQTPLNRHFTRLNCTLHELILNKAVIKTVFKNTQLPYKGMLYYKLKMSTLDH